MFRLTLFCASVIQPLLLSFSRVRASLTFPTVNDISHCLVTSQFFISVVPPSNLKRHRSSLPTLHRTSFLTSHLLLTTISALSSSLGEKRTHVMFFCCHVCLIFCFQLLFQTGMLWTIYCKEKTSKNHKDKGLYTLLWLFLLLLLWLLWILWLFIIIKSYKLMFGRF